MVVSDTLSLLALLASPAVMIWLSNAAESWGWFQAINSNGKMAIIVTLSVLLAIGSFALQEFLASRTDLLGTLDGYVKVAVPLITFFFSQLTYGARATPAEKAINSPKP